MKSILLSFFLFTSCFLYAQSYELIVSEEEYTSLEGSTSLNNGAIWDDPNYVIPVGFDFIFFDTVWDTWNLSDQVGLGGMLSGGGTTGDTLPLIIPFGPDIIDRGYANNQSISNISYLQEGVEGSRILKMEWNNVGFYNDENSGYQDFVNFQMWLHEEDHSIQFRFGPNSVINPEIAYGFESGPFLGIQEFYDLDAEILFGESYFLEGEIDNPILAGIDSTATDLVFLNGTIDSGRVYTFKNKLLSNEELILDETEVNLYPNPVMDELNIEIKNTKLDIQSIEVYDIFGRREAKLIGDTRKIMLDRLSSGSYKLILRSSEGIHVKTFIKI